MWLISVFNLPMSPNVVTHLHEDTIRSLVEFVLQDVEHVDGSGSREVKS